MSEDDTDEESMTLTEAFDFAAQRAAEEVEGFDGEVPQHAGRLLGSRVGELQKDITNIGMVEASEKAETYSDEEVADIIGGSVADVLMAIGALQYEYDLNLGEVFRERVQAIKDYKAFEEAMENAEDQEEAIAAMNEHMTERVEEMLAQQAMGALSQGAAEGLQATAQTGEDEDEEPPASPTFQ